MLAKVVSLFGAGLVLVAYAASQTGRLDARGYFFLLLNLLGGGILTFFALRVRDPGLILMEGSWVAISLGGLVLTRIRRQRALRGDPRAARR